MARRDLRTRRFTIAMALTCVAATAACSGSSGADAAPKPTQSNSPSPSTSPSIKPDGAGFMTYLHQHGVPVNAKPQPIIHLGTTFVCASYSYHESTHEILKQARLSHVKPRRLLPAVMVASVTYLCPQFKSVANLPAP